MKFIRRAFLGCCGLGLVGGMLVHGQESPDVLPADPFGEVGPVPPARPVKSQPAKNANASEIASPSKSNEPLQFTTKLIDDSQLKIEIAEPTIAIVTKYGKLEIPTTDIQKLEIGLRYPVGIETKLNELLGDLANESFQVRDGAEKKIVAYQELALPTIRAAMKDSDKEVSSRAKRIYEQLQASLPEDKFTRKTTDLIVTEEFSARGKIEATELRIKSKIFGPAKLALHEIRDARSLAVKNDVVLTIDASQYGKPNRAEWFDTNFDVDQSNPLQIDAGGQVDLFPQNPGQTLCGPAGYPGNTTSYPNSNGTVLRVTMGALIGRIGTNGPIFVVGAKFKTTRPNAGGRLYLQIAPNQNGVDSSGSYKVKVTQGE